MRLVGALSLGFGVGCGGLSKKAAAGSGPEEGKKIRRMRTMLLASINQFKWGVNRAGCGKRGADSVVCGVWTSFMTMKLS